MQVFLNAKFFGQLGNRMQRVYSVGLPAFACGEDFRPQRHAQSRCLCLDTCHVFGADVDRFVKDCDGFELGYGFERRAQIGFVTFGIRWREGHINVQAGFLGSAQRGEALRRRGGFRLIDLGQIVAQRGRLMPNTSRLPKLLNKSKSARASGLRVRMRTLSVDWSRISSSERRTRKRACSASSVAAPGQDAG